MTLTLIQSGCIDRIFSYEDQKLTHVIDLDYYAERMQRPGFIMVAIAYFSVVYYTKPVYVAYYLRIKGSGKRLSRSYSTWDNLSSRYTTPRAAFFDRSFLDEYLGFKIFAPELIRDEQDRRVEYFERVQTYTEDKQMVEIK